MTAAYLYSETKEEIYIKPTQEMVKDGKKNNTSLKITKSYVWADAKLMA